MYLKVVICFIVSVQLLFDVNSLPVNSNNQCTTKSNGPGTCVKPEKCPTLINNQKQIEMFNMCESVGLICCPNSNEKPNPLGPNKLIPAIINGKSVTTEDFPFMVGLGYPNTDKPFGIEWTCGGSMISSNLILTAAHCNSPNLTKMSISNIVVGRSNLNNVTANETITEFQFIPYDQNDMDPGPKDIAIIKLKHPLEFYRNNNTIKLPQKDIVYETETANVTGFGMTEEKTINNILKQTKLKKLGCRQDVSTEKQLCYGFSSGKKNRGTCNGDSGSPLFVKDSSGQFIQLGIVSYTIGGCARKHEPNVFVKVKYYIDWIDRVNNTHHT